MEIHSVLSAGNCPSCGSDNNYIDYERIQSILGEILIRVRRCESEGKQIEKKIYIPGEFILVDTPTWH